MKTASTAVFCLLMAATAGAEWGQVFKCTGKDGRITYGQVPCGESASPAQPLAVGGSASASAPPSLPVRRPARLSEDTPFRTELENRITAHIASGNYAAARELATSEGHFQRIASAERAQQSREAYANRARAGPVRSAVCPRTGQVVNGTYQANPACN